MKKQNILSSLFALVLVITLALPVISGNPFTPPSAFPNKTDGTIVYASDWNNTIGGLYTYITYTLLPQLNVMANKGDMYVYTGTAITALPVGSNTQVLTADSTQSSGVKWAAGLGLPLTTKGDLLVYNSGNIRLGVGTNGQVLTSDSTSTNGVAWKNAGNLSTAPGMIIMYNPTYGGGIPTGWVICDGTNSTPNLIGMFVVGGQASGGSSSANPSGYGNSIYGTTYGATTVGATINSSGTTSGPSSSGTAQIATTAPTALASTSHTHTVNSSGAFSVTNQPACYALVYIMKS